MNKAVERLYRMANKPERLILGLMSGTSMDGLDMALCRISGYGLNTALSLENFCTLPYQQEFKNDLKSIFSRQWVDLQKVTLLNAQIGSLHAEMILHMLKIWRINPADIDCIASHGQTIYHAPRRLHGLKEYPNATLQIGDGDHLAVKTGIITLSDFRQKHIAAGGEGAPLALYGDYLLLSSPTENRVLLNIGGIANFTLLSAREEDERVISSDTGPGNTLSDALTRKFYREPFDRNGDYARRGRVIQPLLLTMLSHSFFSEGLPKTTGPELFNMDFIDWAIAETGLTAALPDDLIATVSYLTAVAVADSLKKAWPKRPFSMYVSGGGCHNSFIMESLQQLLPGHSLSSTETLGISPDAKEAILFAVLANETIGGSVTKTPGGPAVTMGKISLPF